MNQQNKENTDEIEIDLGEIFGLLLHRLWLILLCGIVCGIIGFIVSSFIITPKYDSTTKIYILNRQNNDNLTLSDTQLASQLTKDYTELVKSRYVLETVIKQCGLNESYGKLLDRVTVANTTDTRIISITVRDESPQAAQTIANAIRTVSASHIKSVMDIEAVNVVDEANLPLSPAAPSITKYTALAAAIGIVLSAIIIVICYLLDDTIKSSEDIEKYLGLSTLALIPLNTGEELSKKGDRRGSERRSARTEEENGVNKETVKALSGRRTSGQASSPAAKPNNQRANASNSKNQTKQKVELNNSSTSRKVKTSEAAKKYLDDGIELIDD